MVYLPTWMVDVYGKCGIPVPWILWVHSKATGWLFSIRQNVWLALIRQRVVSSGEFSHFICLPCAFVSLSQVLTCDSDLKTLRVSFICIDILWLFQMDSLLHFVSSFSIKWVFHLKITAQATNQGGSETTPGSLEASAGRKRVRMVSIMLNKNRNQANCGRWRVFVVVGCDANTD